MTDDTQAANCSHPKNSLNILFWFTVTSHPFLFFPEIKPELYQMLNYAQLCFRINCEASSKVSATFDFPTL